MIRSGLLCIALIATIGAVLAHPRPSHGAEMPEEAAQYHKVLRRQPSPNYLFDRFYNTWLTHASADEMRAFLKAQVEQNNKPADQLLLAFFYARQGRAVRAIEVLRSALADHPADASVLFHKAKLEARTLDFKAALQDLTKAAKAKPTGELAIDIAKLRGRLYARNGQRKKAREVWQALLAKHSQDEYLYKDLIELQLDEGLYQQALKTSKALLKQTSDPYKKVLRRLRMGDIHLRAGDKDKALDVYASTLAEVGGDSWLEREICGQIEQVFRRKQDITGLRDYYKKLVNKHSQRITLRRQYAQVLTELGETDQAMQVWQKILELTPGQREQREAYAKMLAEADRLDEAIAQVEAMIKQAPDDADLRIRLAKLQHQNDADDAAAESVNAYLDKSDKSIFAFLRAGRLLERFELSDEADKVFNRLVKAHADDSAALKARAEFLYRDGKKKKAKKIWRQLAKKADPKGLLRIVRALTSRQENELAYKLLKTRFEALKDNPAYLKALCQQAAHTDRHKQAIPWARRWVRQADSPTQMQQAVAQAADLAEQAEQLSTLLQSLAEQSAPSAAQLCLHAELLEREGRSQQADKVLAKAVEAEPEFGLSQAIRLHKQRQDWIAAASAAQKLLETTGGQRPELMQQIAASYRRAYEPEKALSWVRRWKKMTPGNVQPWLQEAKLLRSDGQRDKAIEVLRRAVQRFPDNTKLRAQLAQGHRHQGQLADAARLYWQLYEDAEQLPTKLNWVKRLAQLAQARGRIKQLVSRFEDRARKSRREITPYMALAEIHQVADNYQQRRQALMEASRIKPKDTRLLMSVARMEQRQGDYDRALATLKRAASIEGAPKRRIHRRMASIHFKLGREQKAYNILFEIAGGQKTGPRGIEQIADAMAGNGDWQRAAQFLSRHLSDHPDDYRLRYLHGVALESSFQTGQAIDAFVRVLGADKPLAKQGKQRGASRRAQAMNRYFTPLRKIVPPETIEMIRMMWTGRLAYQYQQGNQRRGMMGGGGSAASFVQQPSDLDQARRFAMAHLQRLAEQISKKKRKRLVRRVADRGVALAGLMLAMSPEGDPSQILRPDLLETYGDEPAVAAIGILTAAQWREGGITFEQLKQWHDQVKDDRPQLAMMAALAAARFGEKGQKLLKQKIEAMKDLEEPNFFLVMSLSEVLQQGRGATAGLPKAMRQALVDRLMAWYPKMQSQGGWQSRRIFYALARATLRNGQPKQFVKLLDRHVKRAKNQQGGGPGPMFTLGRSSEFIQPLSFPPELAGVPQSVTQLLEGQDMFGRRQGQLDTKGLGEHLDQTDSPALKVLLAHKANKKKKAKALLQKMLDAEQPTLDAYLLAAAHAGAVENQRVRAIKLLDKARYLPMQRGMRRTVDGAIVHWALQQPDNEQIAGIGRRAALRLRRGQLQNEQRQQLAAALERLGATEQAKRLQKKATGTSTPSGMTGVFTGGGSSGPNAPKIKRIRKLILDGKTDNAVKLAARALEQYASSNQRLGYQAREARSKLITFIKSQNLLDKTLAEVKPEDSAAPLKRLRYGRILQALDRPDQAAKTYRAVLKKQKKNAQALWRLAFLTAKDDPKQAAKLLARIPDNRWPSLQQQIHNQLQNTSEQPVKITYNRAEMMLRWLKQRDKLPPGTRPVMMFEIVRRQLEESMWQDDVQLQKLFTQRELSEESPKLDKRRRKLHKQLCKAMLEFPALAPKGFQRLHAHAQLAEESTDRFVKLAKRILTTKPTAYQNQQSRMRARMMAMRNARMGNRSERQVTFRTPTQFIVRYAWQNDKPALIKEDLLPAMRKAGRTTQARQLEHFAELYFAKRGKFIDTAKQYVRATRTGPAGRSGANATLQPVFEAWTDRQLKVDLKPYLLKEIKRSQFGRSSIQNSLSSFLKIVEKREGKDAVQSFLQDVSVIYIGPLKKQLEMVKRHYDPNSWSSNTVNGRIHKYTNILETCAEQPRLALIAVAEMKRLGTSAEQIRWEVEKSVQNPIESVDPDRFMAVLKGSPVLAELKQFDPMTIGTDHASVLGWIVNSMHHYDDHPRRIRKTLKKQPATFGRDLLLAMTQEQNAGQATLELLAKHMDAIEQLPESQRQWLAPLGRTIERRLELPSKPKGPAKKALALLKQARLAQQKSLVQQILDADTPRDVIISSDKLGQKIAEAIGPLVEKDPDKARAVIAKSLTLHKQMARQQNMRRSFSQASSAHFVNGLLAEMIEKHPTGPTLRFLVRTVRDAGEDDDADTAFAAPVTDDLIESCEAAVDTLHQQVNGDGPSALKDLTGHLAKRFDKDEELALLGPIMHDHLDNYDQKQLVSFIQWASQPKQAKQFGTVGKQMVAFARLHVDREGQNDKQKARAVYQKTYNNKNLPTTYRLAVAMMVFNHHDDPPTDLHKTTLNLLAATAKKYSPQVPDDWLLAPIKPLVAKGVAKPLQQPAKKMLNAFTSHRRRHRTSSSRSFGPTQARLSRSHRDDDTLLMLGRLSEDQPSERPLSTGLAMLHLALATDSNGQLGELLNDDELGLTNQAATVLALVRYGEVKRAQTLMRRSWLQMQTRYPAQTTYHPDVAKHLSKFLDGLDKPGLKYLARVILATAPDDENASEDASRPTRRQRLTKLAKRFKNVSFDNETRKHRALMHLAFDHQAGRLVHEAIQKEVGDLKLVHLATLPRDNSARALLKDPSSARMLLRARMLGAHVILAMRQGNLTPAQDMLDQLLSLGKEHGYQNMAGQEIGPLQDALINLVCKRLDQYSPAIAKVAAPFLRKFLTAPRWATWHGHDFDTDMLYPLLTLHYAAGQAEQLPKMRKQWGTHMRHHVFDDFDELDQKKLVKAGVELMLKPEPADRAARVNFLRQMFSHEKARQALTGHANLFKWLRSEGLLDDSALKADGPALAKLAPRGGTAWTELATLLDKQVSDEKRNQFWAKVVKAATSDDALPSQALDVAFILNKHGRKKQARKVLKTVEPDDDNQRNRKRNLLNKVNPDPDKANPTGESPNSDDAAEEASDPPETNANDDGGDAEASDSGEADSPRSAQRAQPLGLTPHRGHSQPRANGHSNSHATGRIMVQVVSPRLDRQTACPARLAA